MFTKKQAVKVCNISIYGTDTTTTRSTTALISQFSTHLSHGQKGSGKPLLGDAGGGRGASTTATTAVQRPNQLGHAEEPKDSKVVVDQPFPQPRQQRH